MPTGLREASPGSVTRSVVVCCRTRYCMVDPRRFCIVSHCVLYRTKGDSCLPLSLVMGLRSLSARPRYHAWTTQLEMMRKSDVRAEMFSIHSIELLCRGSVIPCILTSDRVSQRMSDPSACTMSSHDSRQSPRHPSPRHVNSLGPDKLTVSPDTSPPASNAQYPPAPSSADPTQSTTHLAGPPLPPVPFLCPLLHYSALLPVSRGA